MRTTASTVSISIREHTVTGPFLSMSTCSSYVPGYMKIVCTEPSPGRDAIADESVLNCPDVVVEGFTIIEPEGGEILEAASAKGKATIDSRAAARSVYMIWN